MSIRFKRPLRIIGGGVLLLVSCYYLFKPSQEILRTYDFSQVIYARAGEILRISLSSDDKYRIFTHLNSVSPHLIAALLLKEDKYFFQHPGVNPAALTRAFVQSYLVGGKKIGGSTITMQLARLKYRLETRSIAGKLEQILVALYLDLYYSKNEILEAYINLAPCGGNIEGFGAASLICFDKHLMDITLQEALLLSVLPQNPSGFRPRQLAPDSDLLQAYERSINLWMAEHPKDTKDSTLFSLPLKYQYNVPFLAPHFTTLLRKRYPGEYAVHSTLDLTLQNDIERISQRYVQRKSPLGVSNAAVLLLDASSMEILASMGSLDFFEDEIQGQVNGTTSRRSPGSTLKPFIYALAMEQGLIHPATMLKDAPVSFSEYSPDNYERDFKGPIGATEALITSRNIPAVFLAQQLGTPDLYDLLDTVGVGDLKPKIHYGLSIVLGSAELNMVEIAELYATLLNEGEFQRSKISFEQVEDRSPETPTTLSPEVCSMMRYMLEQNPRPSASQWSLPVSERVPVGFKTGTSIGFKDAWSIGLFDHYVLAVWLGNFNGYGNPAFNGRQLATPLMFEIIDALVPELTSDKKDLVTHELPRGVIRQEICSLSGGLAHSYCSQKTETLYIPGKSPITSCNICREIYINTETGFRTFETAGENIEKRVYEFWPTDLLRLFKQAGIPRVVPPPFDRHESLERMAATGQRPQILSPQTEMEYLITSGEIWYNSLPLTVVAEADVKEIYWFIDDVYIGKAMPDATEYWSLEPGVFEISAVDDHGRSDSRKVTVRVAPS